MALIKWFNKQAPLKVLNFLDLIDPSDANENPPIILDNLYTKCDLCQCVSKAHQLVLAIYLDQTAQYSTKEYS